MQVIYDLNAIPALSAPVITIGSFDGLHLGHMHILKQLRDTANKNKVQSAVITFHPHPKSIVGQQSEPLKLLSTIQEKISLLEKTGIDFLIIIPFTEAFSKMTADAYVNDFLFHHFKPSTIIIGYDHRFGVGRSGGLDLLVAHATAGLFNVIEIPEQIIKDNAISSSLIRQFLTIGDIEQANLLLGRPYAIYGQVAEGNKIGRTIGFPTANILVRDREKLIPSEGVYAVIAKIEGRDDSRAGMMNIGKRPTVSNDATISMEVHLFDFEGDLYGSKMSIHFLKKIRDEIRFDNLQQLTEQLHKDKTTAVKFTAGHKF